MTEPDEIARMARIMEPLAYDASGAPVPGYLHVVAERHASALYAAGYRLRHEHDSRIGTEGADE